MVNLLNMLQNVCVTLSPLFVHSVTHNSVTCCFSGVGMRVFFLGTAGIQNKVVVHFNSLRRMCVAFRISTVLFFFPPDDLFEISFFRN